MSKKVVIALGGNALGKTNKEQLRQVENVSKTIVNLIEKGYELVITHGNGPQVGMINLAMEKNDNNEIPFAECNAMSQGYIGYHLEQYINNELRIRNIDKTCVSVITEVEVSKNDQAFENPTKPIGPYYTNEEALKLKNEKGYILKFEEEKGFRRVVPSPLPKKIIEIKAIETLINSGNIVIACGGGGIPVIKEESRYFGIDAVIDKDLSSSLLAKQINADILLILTNIDKVCINFNKETERPLDIVTTKDLTEYLEKGEFAKGSMEPKVKACLEFVNNTNKKAVITSLLNAENGIEGKNGTIICFDEEEEIL